jgi:hypothetical protein
VKSKTYADFLKPEEKLQARLVSWIKDHPVLRNKLLLHIPAAGEKTPYEKYKWTALGCRPDFPDLIFLEPNDQYIGLAIELKTTFPYKKGGEPKFPKQEAMLKELQKRGYFTCFQWKYDDAKKLISEYFDI